MSHYPIGLWSKPRSHSGDGARQAVVFDGKPPSRTAQIERDAALRGSD